jgi:hypothetical protein
VKAAGERGIDESGRVQYCGLQVHTPWSFLHVSFMTTKMLLNHQCTRIMALLQSFKGDTNPAI